MGIHLDNANNFIDLLEKIRLTYTYNKIFEEQLNNYFFCFGRFGIIKMN